MCKLGTQTLWSPQHPAGAGIPPQAVKLEPQLLSLFPGEGDDGPAQVLRPLLAGDLGQAPTTPRRCIASGQGWTETEPAMDNFALNQRYALPEVTGKSNFYKSCLSLEYLGGIHNFKKPVCVPL